MSHVRDFVLGRVWCPLCYSGRKGRAYYKSHWGWHPPRVPYEEPAWMLKKRQAEANGSVGSSSSYDPGAWGQSFPTLVEFLTLLRWEDGSPRVPGTVTLMAEDGVWKASIRDRAQGVYAFISGKTPGSLLESLEKALVADTLDWRQDNSPQWGGRKKR